MARNGSGTYNLPVGNPVVTGSTISSTWANSTLNDIATALSNSIANDGQTNPTANLKMAGYIHTGVGNATVRTNYAAAGQVQDGTFNYLTSITGTDTIVATAALGMGAYATGMTFRFLPAGANTGAVTININGIGAKAITKNGTTALAAGDLKSGEFVNIIYDGTQFQITGGSILLGSNNTWTGSNTFNGEPFTLPIAATSARPSTMRGSIRFNTTTNQYEGNSQVAGETVDTLTYVTTTATLTTLTNHNLTTGTWVTVSGASPSAYNGVFQITVTGDKTFTYTMASNPGANATGGSYVYGSWGTLGGGATGGNGNQVFVQNDNAVTASWTIPTNKNAMSTGPLTVNSGVIITIPSGSRWVIL